MTTAAPPTTRPRDYRLLGAESVRAAERGLVSARWYQTPIPRSRMKELMARRDGPAIRDTVIWLGLMLASGIGGLLTWGTWWALPCFVVYGVLYGSSGDSRWHEAGHGTAFKTRWMNDVVYQLACFMILRSPTVWRWSHARHHTDTIIVGSDPEIVSQRPPDLVLLTTTFFGGKGGLGLVAAWTRHVRGKLTAAEKSFVPEAEWPKVYRVARIWAVLYVAVIALALATWSILPLMYIGLPSFYGAFMLLFFGLTQHAGLAEDVLDHRLNTRTVYMNPVFRFLYWNMNYHVEHHMYPMVPFHQLPALHAEMKADCPPPYPSCWAAYKEIVPTLLRQRKDPSYFVVRPLPVPASPAADAS
jgi:fatty acid desaturase